GREQNHNCSIRSNPSCGRVAGEWKHKREERCGINIVQFVYITGKQREGGSSRNEGFISCWISDYELWNSGLRRGSNLQPVNAKPSSDCKNTNRSFSTCVFLLETQGNKPMGMLFVIDLEGRVYRCKHCNTHLGRAEDIISKTFRCKHGKAYLFDKIVNISIGEREDREMMTGWHTVVDISCVGCGSIVGWKYEAAHDMNQMYKVGKFIIERFKVLGPDGNVFEDQQEEGSDSED
ncbi:Protein yippee-like At3g08990, partial [Linum perenne]